MIMEVRKKGDKWEVVHEDINKGNLKGIFFFKWHSKKTKREKMGEK